MGKIPIGLQLYSVREACAANLPGTLAAVAKMGYDGVEFAGYHGRSAAELRAMLDDVGLRCCGTHIGLDTLLGNELPRTVEFNRVLGNRYLIVPGLPEARRNSAAAWRETAALFNAIAARLAPYGMYTGYHNHHIEFQPMDGEIPWDIFFGNTAREVVMQLDTGNARHGGADPAAILARYPHRARVVHLKEYSATKDKVVIGEGDEDWPRILELCETVGGTEWYVVEEESYPYPPLESVRRCIAYLRGMGK